MKDHFNEIETERQLRGDQPLEEELIELLSEHERGSGTVKQILAAQDAIKAALGKKHIKLLLAYESLMTDRTADAERIAYNLGVEHGLARGRSELIEDPVASELAVAVSDVIVRLDVGEKAVLQALAGLLAGLAGR